MDDFIDDLEDEIWLLYPEPDEEEEEDVFLFPDDEDDWV